MTLAIEDWGTLIAVRRSDDAIVAWVDAPVSRIDAQQSIGRRPDFEDAHVVSWGRLSFDDATRLLATPEEPDEAFHELRSRLDPVGPVDLTLFYSDGNRGY